ncbi:hypothetical protein BCR35DRAFT_44841 [Leucosporidium creatinivorum]|uniref:Uncharacterized protein n=1 Tax=Leucosporidium creatinivorum TaxID=106004 RepID=A0A1Y2FRS3_9BASI|nr:hypothetical protein BCR35DRAFT_44841 [Leucosporidium creatinivorum]
MSHLAYTTFKGIAEKWSYSQAVRIGDRIESAGQGGWHTDIGVWEKELNSQVDFAFGNVDRNLKLAGGKG